MLSIKKFNKEIENIKNISEVNDRLSPLEFSEIKHKVLSELRNPQTAKPENTLFFKKYGFARLAFYVIVCIFLVSGTAFAAGSANPGDFLYPIKRTGETVLMAVAITMDAQTRLRVDFAKNRIKEFSTLQSISQNIEAVSESKTDSFIDTLGSIILNKKNGPEYVLETKELENLAKQEAQIEVENTVKVLNQVKEVHKLKGEDKKAQRIESDIQGLINEAKRNGLKVKVESENGDSAARPDVDIKEKSTINANAILKVGDLKKDTISSQNLKLQNQELPRSQFVRSGNFSK